MTRVGTQIQFRFHLQAIVAFIFSSCGGLVQVTDAVVKVYKTRCQLQEAIQQPRAVRAGYLRVYYSGTGGQGTGTVSNDSAINYSESSPAKVPPRCSKEILKEQTYYEVRAKSPKFLAVTGKSSLELRFFGSSTGSSPFCVLEEHWSVGTLCSADQPAFIGFQLEDRSPRETEILENMGIPQKMLGDVSIQDNKVLVVNQSPTSAPILFKGVEFPELCKPETFITEKRKVYTGEYTGTVPLWLTFKQDYAAVYGHLCQYTITNERRSLRFLELSDDTVDNLIKYGSENGLIPRRAEDAIKAFTGFGVEGPTQQKCHFERMSNNTDMMKLLGKELRKTVNQKKLENTITSDSKWMEFYFSGFGITEEFESTWYTNGRIGGKSLSALIFKDYLCPIVLHQGYDGLFSENFTRAPDGIIPAEVVICASPGTSTGISSLERRITQVFDPFTFLYDNVSDIDFF